jgi:hypothetical protein
MKTTSLIGMLAAVLALVGCATHAGRVNVNAPLVTATSNDVEAANGSTDSTTTFDLEKKFEECNAMFNRKENGPAVAEHCLALQQDAMQDAQELIDRNRNRSRGPGQRGPGMGPNSYPPGAYAPGFRSGGYGAWGYGGGIAPPMQNMYAGTGLDPAQGYGAYPTTMYISPGQSRPQGVDPVVAKQLLANARAQAKLEREIEELKKQKGSGPPAPKPAERPPPPPSEPAAAP